MPNPIKSLLPTPLSMELISNFNILSKLPLPIYKFFINCVLTSKSSPISLKDQNLLVSILKREHLQPSIRYPLIYALKLLENFAQKILKLMRTSEIQQIQSNLQNCQKYIASVLSENTLIDQTKLSFLLQKLATFIHDSLTSPPQTVETKFGIAQWSIYNLKKTSMCLSQTKTNFQSQEQKAEQKSTNKNLRQMNKMYVKVSFQNNFSTSPIQKLIQTGFDQINQGLTQCKIESQKISVNDKNDEKKIRPKSIIMSLIDFRIFMEELQKVKNSNS